MPDECTGGYWKQTVMPEDYINSIYNGAANSERVAELGKFLGKCLRWVRVRARS